MTTNDGGGWPVPAEFVPELFRVMARTESHFKLKDRYDKVPAHTYHCIVHHAFFISVALWRIRQRAKAAAAGSPEGGAETSPEGSPESDAEAGRTGPKESPK